MSWLKTGAVLALALLVGLSAAGPAAAQGAKKILVVALNQDPDILDPTLSQTYVGRIIYANMCEKLYEIDESLTVHPQLAAELPRFSDGGKSETALSCLQRRPQHAKEYFAPQTTIYKPPEHRTAIRH